jgi:predicted small secreted protein
MKNIRSVLILLTASLTLSSCNTFIGIGRDIENLGNGMQNKAEGKTWSGQTKAPAEPAAYPAY